MIDISADDAMNFLAIFEENKGWHGFNAVFLRNGLSLINIAFEKNNLIFEIASAPIFDFWCNTNARTTPSKQNVEKLRLIRNEMPSPYVAKKSKTTNLPWFFSSPSALRSSSRVDTVRTMVTDVWKIRTRKKNEFLRLVVKDDF